ncbi:MAG: hypothetical protein ACE5K7_00680 [Phycisphaerae bacterium]
MIDGQEVRHAGVDDGWRRLAGGGLMGQAVLWVIAALLGVIAGMLVLDGRGRAGGAAYGQAGPGGPVGARGIYMVPARLSPSSYGLFMMDVDAGTIWCYEYVAAKRRLRLAAARSWIFDRYLEEYNIDGIIPSEVAKLVEKQRSQRARAQGLEGEPIPAGSP